MTRELNHMKEKMFMRVDEVAEKMDVSKPYAYKIIKRLNEELKKKGYITITGRIDRKYFYEKFYSSKTNE
jgi:Mn-dependent DtxR family transcriptional regulator